MCEERQEREEQVLQAKAAEIEKIVFLGQGGGWSAFLDGMAEYTHYKYALFWLECH